MKRVLVGLSGGVDSAVAAYLLKQQGYDVVGGFMKNYVSETGFCTTHEDADMAIKVAKFLGIELLSFDLQKEYKEKIIDYIFDGYQKGITPNPDVLCNSLIKFDVFLEKALEQSFDMIATGHYADKTYEDGFRKLLRANDLNKDQSYFLSRLNQKQLSYSLFPLGGLQKGEVRKIAHEIGLPNADRKDSQGLCFIGPVAIKEFLLQKLPKKKGHIIDLQGNVVGQHEGAYFYTLGQRHGLGLNFKCYVVSIDVQKNIVVVGDKESPGLVGMGLKTLDWHWIGKECPLPCNVDVKIRYRQQVQSARMDFVGENMQFVFEEQQWAITPGQFVVAYLGTECLGSGVIDTLLS